MGTSKIKENLFAGVVAAVLALFVIFFINNTKFLKADIMGTQQAQQKNGDVIYNIDDKGFTLSSQKNIDNVKSVSILLMFDKDKIKIAKEDIKTNYDFTFSDAGEGAVNIILQNVNKINQNDELLNVALNGEKNINISEVFVNFADGSQDVLSISKK